MNTSQPQQSSAYSVTVVAISAIVIGMVTAIAATGFVAAIQWLNDNLFVSPLSRATLYDAFFMSPVVIVLVTTLGGLVTGLLVSYISNLKRPLGPPDTIQAVQLNQPMPDTKSGLVSTLAAVISLGCGASVGQYGPLVYMGALVGDLLRKLQLGFESYRSIFIACGVAAAISSAFSAPIAGLVFAHEVILRHYSMRAFAPTTISAATGYIFSDQIFEIEPLFLIEFSGVENSGEFILFILVGLLSACLALFFISSLLSSQRHAKELPLPAFVKPAIAGFVLGLFALILPEILGIGTEAMRFATIEGAYDIKELAVLIIAKIAVTILCISFGFVGGVFSPLLLIGILFGAFNWLLIDEIFNIPNSGVTAYAIAGMMAVTSPVIGAPLTCILIVFELTRNYELTIAAMVAVVFSNLVVAKTLGRSLFDCQLLSKGINLAEGRDKAILQATSVGTLVRTDFPIACIGESATSLNVKLEKSAWSEAYIISPGGEFLGTYRPIFAQNQSIEGALHLPNLIFVSSTSLWEAMESLEGFVGDAVPVIDDDKKLVAVVTEADIITAYMGIIHQIQQEERASI